MLKKSKLILLLVVASLMLTSTQASIAQDSADKTDPALAWTIGLPFKLAGAALAATSGLIVGSTAGFLRGAIISTKYLAGVFGDEDSVVPTIGGAFIGAVPGGAAFSVYGGFEWLARGAWIGLQRPFEHLSVSSALEGVPLAIEEASEGASEVFADKV